MTDTKWRKTSILDVLCLLTNLAREVTAYSPSSLRFSYPCPYQTGDLQKGEILQNMDFLFFSMFAAKEHGSTSTTLAGDDDEIPDLIAAHESPRLHTYSDGCVHNSISVVKSKL
ncbi:hypothetical protein C8J57DRAFT_1221944 [Mycena rebaudengoi]|nr:hypothetical protein C8J57DRAFT_1221944 [Mycena rebaudengoi]